MATLTRGYGGLLRVGVRKSPGEEAAVSSRSYGDFALVPTSGRALALFPRLGLARRRPAESATRRRSEARRGS